MNRFNLLDEPWLPVLDAEVDLRAQPDAPVALREVGLREALSRAHEIREVYSDAPLETVALYRLLLALAIDAYTPEADPEAWLALWNTGHFPSDTFNAYLDQHDLRGRFDLMSAKTPFYQHPEPHPSMRGKDPAPLAKLFHAEASGNNATLFGHEMDNVPRAIRPAEAARGLVATQAVALGGGVSRPFNFSHAPLVGGAVFWIRGRSLFDALLLNAPPDRDARMADDDHHDDAPAWRQPLPDEHRKRPVRGYLDYLTLQARRLTLVTDIDEDDRSPVATGVFLTQGDKDDPAVGILDPLMARNESKKGVYPFGFRADRALWRDANVLFQLSQPGGKGAPRTFEWLTRMAAIAYPAEAEELEAGGWLVDVFGVVNDKAKVEQWRHERFPLYERVLGDARRLIDLGHALDYAAEQEGILRGATRTVADYLLDPPPPGSDEAPSPDAKTRSNLIASLDTAGRYWTALEPQFYALLLDLACTEDAEDRQERLWQWAKTLYRTASDSFREATSMLDQNARTLRAQAQGQRRLAPIKPYRDHRDNL